jgi:hypothetical protein
MSQYKGKKRKARHFNEACSSSLKVQQLLVFFVLHKTSIVLRFLPSSKNEPVKSVLEANQIRLGE